MKTFAAVIPFFLASASVNAIALPGEEYHIVKDTDAGPVYSNMPAHQRRDAPEAFYPISANEHGTVYSNVAPADHQKRDNGAKSIESHVSPIDRRPRFGAKKKNQPRDSTVYTPLSDDEAKKYIEKQFYSTAEAILDEALGPTLATDEGRKFLEAQERQTEVLSLLEAHDPPAAQYLRELLLQYAWQQITPFTLQSTLRGIYSTDSFLHTPSTYDPICPFLEVDIASPEDEKKAKELLHEAWGTLTQPAPEGLDPVGNWERNIGVYKEIEV
ncbi:MAG: hypothetical protein Q9225_001220 [Loekoesia sp. 1 TL-2023]